MCVLFEWYVRSTETNKQRDTDRQTEYKIMIEKHEIEKKKTRVAIYLFSLTAILF